MPGIDLINEIRRLRFEHDRMTQQALADKVQVSRQTIIALESGRYAPSLVLAMRIARVFDQPVESVFQLTDENFPEE
ncbi:MAG TPA: transcriptional regulator [Phycisphaerales bacterium]|nr:transcriptional regulator [Phycisphaerales bacterium]HCD34420.1 transcriptional regulator [Phycisphaerales bacterium]|tara:strand:+ start:258 stop:488 length:231 start_codon:yes stop_codon:yes gene_type:complete